MKLPTPDTIRDRLHADGRPLRLDPASSWADCLAAWVRERGAQLDEDGA